MDLHYEFGGDDYHDGDSFELEITTDERDKAIASYAVDAWFESLKRKNPDKDYSQVRKQSRKALIQFLTYVLYDLDLVTDDLEESMQEIIEEYYYDKAYDEYHDEKVSY